MDEHTYRNWRRQVAADLGPTRPQEEPPRADSDRWQRQIERVVAEARRVATAIGSTLPEGSLLDRNKYDFVLSILDRVLAFDDFVLCEYTYELPGGARPGVRLLLEMGPAGRQISAVLFEDVRRWQLDPTGHKISYQLLALLLGRDEIVAHVAAESADYFQPGRDWQEHLHEALCLPFRLLDES